VAPHEYRPFGRSVRRWSILLLPALLLGCWGSTGYARTPAFVTDVSDDVVCLVPQRGEDAGSENGIEEWEEEGCYPYPEELAPVFVPGACVDVRLPTEWVDGDSVIAAKEIEGPCVPQTDRLEPASPPLDG
jgi:hypothetical protein